MYRHDQRGVHARRDDALAAWSAELAELDGAVERVVVARWARPVVAVVVALTVAVVALAGPDPLVWSVPALVLALAILLARRLAHARLERRLRAHVAFGADPIADADRLSHETPALLLAGWAARAEVRASVATLVLAGLALPLASSALALAFSIFGAVPLGAAGYFLGRLAAEAAWMAPLVLVHAILTARRWARLDAEAIERRPVGVWAVVVVLVLGLALGASLHMDAHGGPVPALAAGTVALMVLLGLRRLRGRLVEERGVLQRRAR